MAAKKTKSRSGPSQTYEQLAQRGVRRIVVYSHAEDVAALEGLQEAWGMGQSEAARRAWREAIERLRREK